VNGTSNGRNPTQGAPCRGIAPPQARPIARMPHAQPPARIHPRHTVAVPNTYKAADHMSVGSTVSSPICLYETIEDGHLGTVSVGMFSGSLVSGWPWMRPKRPPRRQGFYVQSPARGNQSLWCYLVQNSAGSSFVGRCRPNRNRAEIENDPP
jgi:hypothetical protein